MLVRDVAHLRRAVVLLTAAMALAYVPPMHILAWMGFVCLCEIWSHYGSRPLGPAGFTTRAQRVNFIGSTIALNAYWLAISCVLISLHSMAGEVCGLAIVAFMTTHVVLLFHASPVVYVATGAVPCAVALGVVFTWLHTPFIDSALIWVTLILGTFYIVGRSFGIPSAQQQKDWLEGTLGDYAVILENIQDIIIHSDSQGRCLYASPSVVTMMNIRPEDMIGRKLDSFIDAEGHAAMKAAFGRVISGQSPTEDLTVRALATEDGAPRWCEVNLRRLEVEAGQPSVLFVCREVTARVAADQALRDAKREAEAANLAKATVMANVSHEIRTPMNAVLGALRLIEGEPLSPEGAQLVRRAIESGKMLSQLLNDVLDFSRIEAGQLELAPEAINLADMVSTVTGLLAPSAKAKGLAFHEPVLPADLWIEADPFRLQQVLFNLVGNAVKFTERGGIDVQVVIENRAADRLLIQISITDTGPGMSEETQGQVFERFRQAEDGPARRYGGAGLGLAISRALMERMGGELGFDSQVGKGSTFWFRFEVPRAASVAETDSDTGALTGLKILLADDNPTNRLVASTILRRLGADVIEAEDGLEALNAARACEPDLILMDIQMPHMDGLEAARAIRALAQPIATVPIIALTANAMAHQRQTYEAAGMSGLVAKPISPEGLVLEIYRVLTPDGALSETPKAISAQA